MRRRTSEGTLCAKLGCGKCLGPRARMFCSRSCSQRGNSKGKCTRDQEIEKFWSQVQKSESCWTWTGYRGEKGKGYGRCNLDNKKQLAHRVSWQIHFGSIDDGLFVLHKCDNYGCVRHDHLFLGTNQDNMKDAQVKGRLSCGNSHRLAIARGLLEKIDENTGS